MKRINYRNQMLSAILLVITIIDCNFAYGQQVTKQGPPVPVKFCIDATEMDLYRKINEYRRQNNLPPIPLSKSLSYIAAIHAKDLFLNHPDQGPCNFHSWSDKGSWTPFCYPKDESKKRSVWDRPRELTKYPSKAYEIVYWENNPLVEDTIIMVWKTEEYFNSFLLNIGKWQGRNWNAIGIAVYKNYACAWFGEFSDPEGEAIVCGSKLEKQVKDTTKPVAKPVAKPVIKPLVNQKKPKTTKSQASGTDSLKMKNADTVPVKSSEPIHISNETPVLSKDSATGTYYIIVKTNLNEHEANKFVADLRKGGYPDARVLGADGKTRISVFESTDKPVVMTRLKEVKRTFKDAWLLKK